MSKFLKYGLIAAIIAVKLAALAFFFYLNSHSGKDFVKNELCKFIEKKIPGSEFHIEKIDGYLPLKIQIHQCDLKLSQENKNFHSDEIKLVFSPFSLLKGIIYFPQIDINQLSISLLKETITPVTNKNIPIDETLQNASSPKLPGFSRFLDFHVEQLNIHDIYHTDIPNLKANLESSFYKKTGSFQFSGKLDAIQEHQIYSFDISAITDLKNLKSTVSGTIPKNVWGLLEQSLPFDMSFKAQTTTPVAQLNKSLNMEVWLSPENVDAPILKEAFVKLNGQLNFESQAIQLDIPKITLYHDFYEGIGSLKFSSPKNYALELQAEFKNLKNLYPHLTGSLQSKLSIIGQPTPKLNLNLTSKEVGFFDQKLNDLEICWDGDLNNTKIKGFCTYEGQESTLEGAFQLKNDTLTLSSCSLKNSFINITPAGSYSFTTGELLLNLKNEGNSFLWSEISAHDFIQTIQLKGLLNPIQLNLNSDSNFKKLIIQGSELENVSLNTNLNIFQVNREIDTQGTIDLKASNILTQHDMQIPLLSAQISVLNKNQYGLNWHIEQKSKKHGFNYSFEGVSKVFKKNKIFNVSIDSIKGSLNDTPFEFNNPLEVILANKDIEIHALSNTDDAVFEAHFKQSMDSLDGFAKIRNLSLMTPSSFFQSKILGFIDLDLDLKASNQELKGFFDAKIKDLSHRELTNSSPLNIEIQGILSNHYLNIKGSLDSPSHETCGSINGKIPVY